MPIMDGFEFLTWKSTSRFFFLPVIVLEGTGDKQDQQQARTIGATLALTKHFELDRLFKIVQEIAAFDPSHPGRPR